MTKLIILFIYLNVSSGLLFTNIYTSLIDVKSWGADIPDSIATARAYFEYVTPRKYFKIFGPINYLLGILALIIFWHTSISIRIYLAIALLMYILDGIFTFVYFFPRNDILFRTGELTNVEKLKETWVEWNYMNWIRSLIVLLGILFSFLSLYKIIT